MIRAARDEEEETDQGEGLYPTQSLLLASIQRDHDLIALEVRNVVAEIRELRIELVQILGRPTFWGKLGDNVIVWLAKVCESPSAHRAALALITVLTAVPILWIAAVSGISVAVPGWIELTPKP